MKYIFLLAMALQTPVTLPEPIVTKPQLVESQPPAGNYREKTQEMIEYAEAQKKRDAMTAPELATAYQKFLSELIPSYNYIEANLVRRPYGGSSLVGYHPFFNKYAFSTGPFVKHVGRWVQEHCTALKNGKIGEVGVGGYSDRQTETAFKMKTACP